MQTFLENTLDYLEGNYQSLAELTLILPSKRAAGFLLHYLKRRTKQTAFAPRIVNIEQFIEEVANLKIVDNTQLLFKSYAVYLSLKQIKEKESFENYSSWATTLLGDFNEIDRYLLDQNSFFNYLSSIQDVNHWYLSNEKTDLVKNYLSFWDSLPEFYESLQDELIKKNSGYQGMVNRKAAEEIEHYISANQKTQHVFIGFNALNKAEQVIIQELISADLAKILWDADQYFLKDKKHSVSLFMQSYATNWKMYQDNPFTLGAANFEKPKQIHLVEASKNISQVKYVGDLLSNMTANEIENTAIILADESLLIPMLHSLPANVEKVNVTMGVPLTTFPLVSFFELLLLFKTKQQEQIYFKDIVAILSHPFGKLIFNDGEKVIKTLQEKNIAYCDIHQLLAFTENDKDILALLFATWSDKSTPAIKQCLKCITIAKKNTQLSVIDNSVLFELYKLFKQLEVLQEQYAYLSSSKSTLSLYRQLVASATLDYRGDAYDGLQIMGLLESRVLDFKNVIMTSVNEGTLPSGKSNASFITYDLKQQFELPKYTEKDAIYAYHFYRSIQRAESCTLIYNSYSDGINTGEKSRFIKQLEVFKLPHHSVKKIVIGHNISMEQPVKKEVLKTEAVMQEIKKQSARYFSPSALTSYIRNPIDFYYQRILKLKELSDVEETVASSTMGTIVHNTLENLYKPLIGKPLTSEILKGLLPAIEKEVKRQFSKEYKEGDYTKGKNLIIFEVVKKFVGNFIHLEIRDVEAGNTIVIQSLEKEYKKQLTIPQLDFPVVIGGKIDRVDTHNDIIRIIDYKTGMVKSSDLEIVEWDLLQQDYKYSKAFQVLTYALICQKEYNFNTAEAGIISFKNLNSGFLKFATKPSARSRSKNTIIDEEVLANFKVQLTEVILELCNPEIPFTEKEIL